MHGLSPHKEIAYWRERAERAECERDEAYEQIAKANTVSQRTHNILSNARVFHSQDGTFIPRIEALVAERDRLRAEVESHEHTAALRAKQYAEQREERDRLRAENKRVRAVFDAAVEWRERGPGQSHCDEKDCPCTSARLKKAIDSALAGKGET